MVAQLNRLMSLLFLHSLLVQPVQAEPVDSVRVENEHHAATQKKMEPKEITIYISGQHKAMVAALLDAVDEGTSVTGIADFDSLSFIYGLIGIDRTGRMSSFYPYRFRLTFPPAADVATIARAYWNLSYVESVEPKMSRRTMDDMRTNKRIGNKLIAGTFVGGMAIFGGVAVGAILAPAEECPSRDGDDPYCGLAPLATGVLIGSISYPVGTAVGVSRVDPYDRFIASLGGSVVGLIGGIGLTSASPSVLWPSLFIGPVVGATVISELWRKPPQDSQNSRVSFGLSPIPNGGLSAVTALHF
ncbi:MAG: hypothetical protein J4F35_06630 [Candidatus Latescibacteria bacterium]|nr:hypothetical protein [Candidatus Latescibacterota bacterium]